MSDLRGNPASSSVWDVARVVGIIAVLYFAREVLVPLAFALTLTFVLTPVVKVLEKLRMGRFLSVVLALVMTLAVFGWVGWIIGNQLVDVANQLPRYKQNIHAKIEALKSRGKGPLSRAAQSVKDIGKELSRPQTPAAPAVRSVQNRKERNASEPAPAPVQIVPSPSNELTDLRDLVTPFLRPLALAGIVLIFAVFMLLKREDLRNRLLRLVGLSQLNVMTQALDDAAQRVSRYLLMQFLVNAGFGALFGTGLYFIGVPSPALWGVLAAILRIVPYVGTLFAAALPVVLSLAVFDGWQQPVLVFALFAFLEIITGNFLEPWLYGAHTGISSLALLVTTAFWTFLWGPAGLILSTPLTVCVVVLGRYFPPLSFLHILLGDEPALEAEAQLYQRLLAMDQQDGRAVIESLLKEGKTLVEVYDSVLIPALSLAEQDRHKGTIDATREEFLFLSISEMVAEFSESPPPRNAAPEENGAEDQRSRDGSEGRVLCIPSHDRADEIVAAMLSQVLDHEGCVAVSFPLGASPLEMIALLAPEENDIIFVSALPPYAFSPARTLCKQIRRTFPKTKLLVGVWGYQGDMDKAVARFERARPDQLITSLAQALEEIMGPAELVSLSPGQQEIADDLAQESDDAKASEPT
jgi:predicted PurR-regulated permease PerM